MCGIAGLILAPPGPVGTEQIRSFSQLLEHRGPDDFGVLFLQGKEARLSEEISGAILAEAALVHRRLSILDLSKAGWQPMGTPDGRYYIVFNGEVYNFLELREELRALRHQFRSRSDTEALLAAYAQWGTRALNRLVGMFAFAILDSKERKLFLARDFFGIKPLYYTYWRGGFAFASEIVALLELPGVSRRANPQRLYDYLHSGMTDHGEETLFADVKQLPAAHYMEVSLDDPRAARPVCYWRIGVGEKIDLSFDEAAARLRDLFLESVRLHLRSDVPLGAALSGGIDSSSIVMAMRHLDPKLDIHTFSYVADNSPVNEERWAELVSTAANAVMYKVKSEPDELVADLDRLIGVQGESFGSTSIYAQRRVFRRAREAGIKVMLDGQGADELLGGYYGYIVARIGSLLRQGKWTEAVQLARHASRLPGAGTWWLWSRVLGLFVPSDLQDPLRRWVKKDLMPPWLNAQWFAERGVKPWSPIVGNSREMLRESLQESVISSLPHLLRYEDRNSMAFSIESRVPFLTPALANFILALPEHYIVAHDGTTKSVFRQAMRGLAPDAILNRRDKIGFATPEKDWLVALRPWVERVLSSEAARQIPALNLQEARKDWEAILQGRSCFDWRVWRWINTILWTQKFAVETT